MTAAHMSGPAWLWHAVWPRLRCRLGGHTEPFAGQCERCGEVV